MIHYVTCLRAVRRSLRQQRTKLRREAGPRSFRELEERDDLQMLRLRQKGRLRLATAFLSPISPDYKSSPRGDCSSLNMKPEKTKLRGHTKDKRFNPILQQSLGRVAETLARRLLVSEGFEVRKFSRYVSPYVAEIRHSSGMGGARRQQLWDHQISAHDSQAADPRVREFVDELVQFRISRKHARG